ncbi:sugar-transfer associated ATP-grasp domain-containing protein [Halomonas stenophila]|uniref:Alpha-L-glutamate ligase-related protein ATP-grasp domain-containing protein n=1 Tax=Halomonas stenophila TaxID=795312 RepID=A0A7W5ESX8_9GAMM|nr:sugar-transfer associated ATP-grasp domain-containing protein [Halomonas stenophila]MBB3230160.1 hypothetical protein [Halomonas stenophila]
MFSGYHQSIHNARDGEALQAWKSFSLAYWEEPGFGLSEDLQQRLFHAGFLRSRWALYDMAEHGADGYLSDFQAMRLQAANAKYQTVMADRVLCSHVVSNYCPAPEIYCVVTAEEVQWVAAPWWHQDDHAPGELIVHPMQSGAAMPYQRVALREGRFHSALGEGGSDELVSNLQQQARQHGSAYVVSEHVSQGAFAETLAPGHLNLLNVLLVREQHEWRPQLASATLLIGRQGKDGEAALRVEEGALSAAIDHQTGLITACKGLDEGRRALTDYAVHPQSGSRIVGQSLPGWQEIRRMLMAFFDEASYLRTCNLSFVLTDDGPCFFAACEGQLATHQIHRPLLDDPFISSHVNRLES